MKRGFYRLPAQVDIFDFLRRKLILWKVCNVIFKADITKSKSYVAEFHGILGILLSNVVKGDI